MSIIRSLAAAAPLALAASSFAATLIADYRFQNTLSSSIAGAPPLTSGLTFETATVGGVPTRVGRFAANDGPTLDASALGISGGYSVVVLFEFDAANGYRKILDVSNLASDLGLYVLSGSLTYFTAGGAGVAGILDGEWAQVTFTRDGAAAPTTEGFKGRCRSFTFADTASQAAFSGGTNLRFFQDDAATGGRESTPGRVARIRVYAGALTAAEVGGLDSLPGVTPPCRGDIDSNCEVNANDISSYLNAWYTDVITGAALADYDLDGETNANDISAFLNDWYAGVTGAC